MYVSRLKFDILSCTRLYVGASYVLVCANVSLPVCMCVCARMCSSFLLPMEHV